MPTVGIPRALFYYHYFPMWRTFFEALGGQVVASEETTRAIVADGCARVVAETCLPAKVYLGHAARLAGKCDFLFIPSLRSIEPGVVNCSKFLGLPDLVRAVVPGCPPILEPDIDLGKGKRAFYMAIYHLAKPFTFNPFKVKRASEEAWRAHLAYQEIMSREGLTPPEAMEYMGLAPPNGQREGQVHTDKPSVPSSPLSIALIGHPYVLYDSYITNDVLGRLAKMGVRVLTPEMVSPQARRASIVKLGGKPYWMYEDEMVGAGGHYLDDGVDGVIAVVAFACGPDSTMLDLVQHYRKEARARPLMCLAIDEHTGVAGLVTRLEAFVDMVERRRWRQ